MRSLVLGGTGRLGRAVAQRLQERGDEVFALGRSFDGLPEGINYAIFCQRDRSSSPWGEFEASVLLTDMVLQKLGWADDGPTGIVIVSSIAGAQADLVHPVAYQCAKAAAIHLGKHWALKGHRVNVLTPGAFTGKVTVTTIDALADEIVGFCAP